MCDSACYDLTVLWVSVGWVGRSPKPPREGSNPSTRAGPHGPCRVPESATSLLSRSIVGLGARL